MKKQFLTDENFIRFEQTIHIIILMNVVAFTLESVKELNQFFIFFQWFENISLFIFIVEYGIRVYFAYKVGKAWQYVFSFMGIVDLITIMPTFLAFYTDIDLRFTKILRFFQIFRIFKVYRHSEHLQTITKVLVKKRHDLFATLFATSLIIVFCAFITYFFEKDVQPQRFSNMFMAFYWAVETLTTTGYGDIYPITVGGRMVATFLALVGIGLLAIPAAILSAGFVEIQAEKNQHKHTRKHDHQE